MRSSRQTQLNAKKTNKLYHMKNRLKIYSKQNYRYNSKTSLLDFFCITVKKRKNKHGYKSLIQKIRGLKKGRV